MKFKSVFLAHAFLALSACAVAGDYKQDTPRVEKELLPFSIGFRLDGTAVVLDENNKVVQPKEVSLPTKAEAIEALGNISYVKYKGSCKVMMVIGGVYYLFDLPKAYCDQVN